MRILLDELPRTGEEFVATVRVETGGALLAAVSLETHWNPGAAQLVRVEGGLSTGASAPFVFNDLTPGRLIISDINAPRRTGAGGATYNPAMSGQFDLYRIVLRRVSEAPLGMRGQVDNFHDPGEGMARPPAAIGGGGFPRLVRVQVAGAQAPAEHMPIGAVWLSMPSQAPGRGELVEVGVFAQLAATPLDCFSLNLRFDARQLDFVRAKAAGDGKLASDSAVPGRLWISGGAGVPAEPDDLGRARLCTIELRALAGGEVRLEGSVVSFHQAPGPDGEPRQLGPLPLPRRIEQR